MIKILKLSTKKILNLENFVLKVEHRLKCYKKVKLYRKSRRPFRPPPSPILADTTGDPRSGPLNGSCGRPPSPIRRGRRPIWPVTMTSSPRRRSSSGGLCRPPRTRGHFSGGSSMRRVPPMRFLGFAHLCSSISFRLGKL